MVALQYLGLKINNVLLLGVILLVLRYVSIGGVHLVLEVSPEVVDVLALIELVALGRESTDIFLQINEEPRYDVTNIVPLIALKFKLVIHEAIFNLHVDHILNSLVT